MKKILILCILMLTSYLTMAQIDGSFNNSVSVRAFGIMQVPKIQNESKKDNYVNSYLNSITLKFNDNQISYRLSGSYLNDDIDVMESNNGRGTIRDYTIKMGFEKNFNYGVVQPYFLTDLGYRSHEFEGLISTATAAKVTKHGFTLAPGFGLKLNVLRQLTFFAEGNVEFFYFQNKQEITPAGSEARNINKNYQSQFLLNPIFTGLQFHFGNNR
ncbi:hypothetical protein ACTHQF_12125 [Pedobacter sp. SAFR-022]|uniref:hypothetical protein n=1 Tax=Pedobacter sp. SAFR-022 TaxID=3436861 RepID=UPI003F81B9D5